MKNKSTGLINGQTTIVVGMTITWLALGGAACDKARFDSKNDKKNVGADAQPAGQRPKPVLDVSDLEKNKNTNGPGTGDGTEIEKVINLTCKNSQGVEIVIGHNTGGSASAGNPNNGNPNNGNPNNGNPNNGNPNNGNPNNGNPNNGNPNNGNPNNGNPNNGNPTDGGSGSEPNPFGLLGKKKKEPNASVDTDGNIVQDGGEGNIPEQGSEPLPYEPPIGTPAGVRVRTTVKGEFCPKSTNTLTVLFVVDYSGSMGRHVPDDGGPEQAGNDPQINGSCGRLRAAQAIMDKIAALRQPTDQIRIGMVPFAGGVLSNRVMPILDANEFMRHVNKDTFCQYVVQNPSYGYDPVNPGGIDGAPRRKNNGKLGFGGVNPSTNYKAAFNAAQGLLSFNYGRKVVYFISDGQPTSGDSDPIGAGITAGQRLRTSIPNLELNSLFLGAANPQAENVLRQIAGSNERVRRADNANELATEILSFPDGSIDNGSGQAFLTVAPYPTENLGLQYLREDAARDNIWVYQTQPFVLLGQPGKTVVNLVEVTAKGKDGQNYRAMVRIRYKQ